MNKKQSIANTLDFQEFTKRAQQEQQYIDLNFPIAIECDSKQFHDFKKDFKISREIVSCNFMLFRFNGSEICTHYQKILKAKTEEGVLFYNNDIMLVQELVENIQNYINTCILKSLNNKNE